MDRLDIEFEKIISLKATYSIENGLDTNYYFVVANFYVALTENLL